jgi:hypothetical protein
MTDDLGTADLRPGNQQTAFLHNQVLDSFLCGYIPVGGNQISSHLSSCFGIGAPCAHLRMGGAVP